ncbi:Src kinase-associated phosphoprotein 1, partial [Ophiophagus hannah]
MAEIPGCSHWGVPTPMVPGFPPPLVPMYQQARTGGMVPNPALALGAQLMPIAMQQWFTQMIRQGLMGGTQQAITPTQLGAIPVITHCSKHNTSQTLKQSVVLQPYSLVSSEEYLSDYSIEEVYSQTELNISHAWILSPPSEKVHLRNGDKGKPHADNVLIRDRQAGIGHINVNIHSGRFLSMSQTCYDSKIFGSEWQKRWCVLDNTAFYYYANEKSKQPKGIFAIESYHAQLAPYLRKDSRRDCCFELTSPDKRTYEEEEENENNTNKEEAYDDMESFNTPSVTFNQDSTLDLDKEETMVQGKEGIYEVLPGFIRRYANYYQGLWNCTGGHPDELSFQRGDLIYIISKEYNMYGWWVGELNNMVGIVPRNYLMPAYDLEE